MRKKLFLLAVLFSWIGQSLWAADYGLPANIQQGNILHCFDWTIADVKAELPNIAAAGFGSVQLSPLQRADVRTGSPWHDLYRPYDLAFKGGLGTREELKALCDEAATYGIKIIVDVVANHVDKTSGYHDPWWDANGRVRWQGGINYGDRNSITHGQLGDYGDINSELSEVQARGKAYIEDLKSMGVKGIRWDAAKHIGLPSEGCGFWSTVCSVPGMWHYGEILDAPGPNAGIIKEYAKYMSVTDNQYSNGAARGNGGLPTGYGGSWAVDYGLGDHCVYWGESHDTYSNDEWSQNVDQSVIDRAYCAYACRNDAAAIYFSRPNAKGFNNIKVGKGSTAFKANHIAQVNAFRNKMVGRADYFSSNGNAISVTREGGGAVIVMKGSGQVSIANGGGYCPAGTYTDKVSGGTFTVTASTISGNVGSSGVAVLYDGDGPTPPIPPHPGEGDLWILGNLTTGGWGTTPGTGVKMTADGSTYTAKGVSFTAAAGETLCYFNLTDFVGATWDDLNMGANRYGAATEGEAANVGSSNTIVKYALNVDASGCLSWTVPAGSYDITADLSTMKLTVVKAGDGPTPPTPPGDGVNIPGDYNLAYNGDKSNVYYWIDGGSQIVSWPGNPMQTAQGSDGKTYKVYKVPDGVTNVIFNTNGDQNKTADLTYSGQYIMSDNGPTTTKVTFGSAPVPTKPVVSASPASGTTFTDDVTVTLSVSPAATVYYTIDGSQPSQSSTKYSAPFKLTSTTTVKAFGVTSDGTQGDVASFTYTKSDGPGPQPPVPGNNLITDYYKVNPDGKVGTQKTIHMSFSDQKSTTALSNWTENELIAQGVARDVSQAFRGLHERPIVDSYAIYAAYDNDNLYLGVQFVYTVWDLGGEGKQPGESKPYNMDGHMCWAFDLDPNKSFDGYINGTGPIWNEKQKGAKFDNGVDAVWMGSTKAGVGTPGFFIPTPDGHASYDAAYCKSIPGRYYGYADGLLPSIQHIWGQEFGSSPEALKGNTGFVDIRGDIDDSAHTFYEWTFPLSVLGVTADYIRNNGIGVMYLDKYGTSPVGGTPYDPSYFDNVMDEYSYGDNTSAEKEDEDIITYAPARVGKMNAVGVDNILSGVSESAIKAYSAGGVLYIVAPEAATVKVTNLQGITTAYDVEAGTTAIDGLGHGLYLVEGKKVVL